MKLTTTLAALVVAAMPLSVAATLPTAGAEVAPRAAATYKVKASASSSTAVAKEDVITVSGKVTPKAAGQKIVLQQRLDGRTTWKKTDDAKVKKNGRFVLSDDPGTPGLRFYRVLKPASGKIKAGTSKEFEVTVYRWEKLIQRTSGSKVNIDDNTGAMVGADYYSASLTTMTPGTPAYVEYTLGRKCKSLSATYALTDGSETGATGTVSLTVDGVVKVNESLAIGTLKKLVTDVSDGFRIRFDQTSSSTPGAIPTAANVEVLCTK
ncbi:DUF4369 domain-containing protein [Nocardioides houyundeii]|uniref:DUF4369 domain-containing protein n=1 Tax=Nocardioides houyundeii TaxID=2045452 RepID=UPI000C790C21|nr:DUF4369 domain-containing protein [Nocardioides houyundeii]